MASRNSEVLSRNTPRDPRQSARDLLATARLYGILDLGCIDPSDAIVTCRRMLEGGVDILQLRAKMQTEVEIIQLARQLLPFCESAGVPLIINDHPQLATVVGAAGAHVGQDDFQLPFARRLLRAGSLLGKSTHSLDQATSAELEGADYVGFGPLFATPTKPETSPIGLGEIAEVHARLRIPIFCIGGIKLENLKEVLTAGATRVVIVSGILRAHDIPAYIRHCKELLS